MQSCIILVLTELPSGLFSGTIKFMPSVFISSKETKQQLNIFLCQHRGLRLHFLSNMEISLSGLGFLSVKRSVTNSFYRKESEIRVLLYRQLVAAPWIPY
jgi:hypothetical protein